MVLVVEWLYRVVFYKSSCFIETWEFYYGTIWWKENTNAI